MGIVDEIKLSFKNGNYLTKLIYINIAIWVIVRLVFVGYKLSGSDGSQMLGWLALPASFELFCFASVDDSYLYVSPLRFFAYSF